MNNFNKLLILIIVLLGGCNSFQKGEENNKQQNETFSAEEIYKITVNKTVTIITETTLGSGFFIDHNVIVTNYHVIEGANQIQIALNNSDKKYEVLGYLAIDKVNDLILLQTNCYSIDYINIDDTLPQPGEKIYAIGSPVGLSKTISEGIISGIRNFDERKLLQITAPISHGSSGCPIINEKGKVVGIAVGGISEANNVGFCIPSIFIKSLLNFKESYPKKLGSLTNGIAKNEIPVPDTAIKKSLVNQDKYFEKWSLKNLNVSNFRNGEEIFFAKTKEEWYYAEKNKISAYCYYNFDKNQYGYLGKYYNWFAVNDSRGLAPFGWHIPSMKEGYRLINCFGGIKTAGNKLKTTNGWDASYVIDGKTVWASGSPDNSSGFSAYPNGEINGIRNTSSPYNGPACRGLGAVAEFWSNEFSSQYNWVTTVFFTWMDGTVSTDYKEKGAGLPVRCVQD